MIDILDHSAVYMVNERPDIYDYATARTELQRWLVTLSNDEECGSIGSGGFMLYKHIDEEGVVEFELSRQILSWDDEGFVFDWINPEHEGEQS